MKLGSGQGHKRGSSASSHIHLSSLICFRALNRFLMLSASVQPVTLACFLESGWAAVRLRWYLLPFVLAEWYTLNSWPSASVPHLNLPLAVWHYYSLNNFNSDSKLHTTSTFKSGFLLRACGMWHETHPGGEKNAEFLIMITHVVWHLSPPPPQFLFFPADLSYGELCVNLFLFSCFVWWRINKQMAKAWICLSFSLSFW